MTVCSSLRNLLCNILHHDFGEWGYIVPDSCWQVRTCKRDGYQEKREAHDFDEWKDETSNPCWQVRTCKRDGYQEKRQFHHFGKYEYEASNSCWQVRTCVRDGAQERIEAPHEFSGWIAQEEQWQVYEHGAAGDEKLTWDERKCLRCGYTEKKNAQKWWR